MLLVVMLCYAHPPTFHSFNLPFVFVCLHTDIMIKNASLRGVPLLLLANKQDLEVMDTCVWCPTDRCLTYVCCPTDRCMTCV